MLDEKDKQLIESKFKKAFVLILLPVAVNIALTVLCYLYRQPTEFKGYFVGTFLGMFFSFLWIFMIRKIAMSNIMVLFTLSLGLFPVKLILFAVFAFGGLYLLQMSQLYFGFSFLLGSIFNLLIEVWFIMAVNKVHIRRKSELKERQS